MQVGPVNSTFLDKKFSEKPSLGEELGFFCLEENTIGKPLADVILELLAENLPTV
jgi:hypothetical protein